jgi:hypothetical protein
MYKISYISHEFSTKQTLSRRQFMAVRSWLRKNQPLFTATSVILSGHTITLAFKTFTDLGQTFALVQKPIIQNIGL